MSENENIHSGHRKRMLKRAQENFEALLDHEVLEILLYDSLPRVNTNPIAHRLIKTFGSIKDVFMASVEELSAVSGVGEKTANKLAFIGGLIKRVEKSPRNSVMLTSFEKTRQEIKEWFDNEDKERFSIFLLDKRYKKIAVVDFDNQDVTRVNVEVSEIASSFAHYKPSKVIIAHNHPSGMAEPSESDDLATKKINLLCMAHGVTLADHVIYGKGKVYSYMQSGKLDEIKKKADLNAMLNNL
jgi:DNA repair protein RadC